MISRQAPTENEVRHLIADAKAANEAWLSGVVSNPAEISMYVSNLVSYLDALLAKVIAQRDVVAAAQALYEEVEMAESVGICLPDRVPSLKLGEALAAVVSGT